MHKIKTCKIFLSILVIFIFFAIASATREKNAYGQPLATAEQTAPKETTSPALIIDVSEVFLQAENDEKTISSLINEAMSADTKLQPQQDIEEKISSNFKKIERMRQQQVLSINFINQTLAEWKSELLVTENNFRRLAESLKKIESAKNQLTDMRGKWASSRKVYKEMGIDSAYQKATEMVAKLEENLKALDEAAKERLGEQEKVSFQKTTLENHIKYLTEVRDLLALSKWQQDKPSVISRDFYISFTTFKSSNIKEQWSHYRLDGWDYYYSSQKKIALELIVLLLFWWYLKNRFKEEKTDSEEIKIILRHPLVISVLVIALAANLWHKSAPMLVKEIINLLIFIPVMALLVELIKEKQLKFFLWGMALTYFVGIVRTLFIGFPPLDRLLIILHICLGLVVTVIFYPRDESAKLIFGEGQAFKWSARGRSALLVIFGIALLMQLAGYNTGSITLSDAAFGSVYLSLGVLAVYRLLKSIFSMTLESSFLQRFRISSTGKVVIKNVTILWLKRIAFFLWIYFLLEIWDLDERVGKILSKVGDFGVGYGENRFNLEKLFLAIAAIYFSILLAKLAKFVLEEEIYPRKSVQEGVRGMISQIVKYFVVLIGFLVALSSLGVKLQNITILVSAFGVGIGFGLQNIISNFVSGIILSLEKPIKIGDLVQLDGVWGLVKKIGIRTSIIESWDKGEIIIPNSEILSGKLSNWSLSTTEVGLALPVDVAYGSDPRKVTELLIKVACNHPEVRKEPPPAVFFLEFGDSSLRFELRCFMDFLSRFRVASELRTAIYEEFKRAGIEIPFPQRDIHIKTTPNPFPPKTS